MGRNAFPDESHHPSDAVLQVWSTRSFPGGSPGKRFEYYGEGVRVAAGYGKSGEPMVGTLPGPDQGRPSQLRLFDANGQLLREWVAFPEYDFSGELAMGDLIPTMPGDEIYRHPRTRIPESTPAPYL